MSDKDHKEYLGKFLDKKDNTTNNLEFSSTSSDPTTMDYINVDISQLPLGKFYPENTEIKIRAAKVHEVQRYSVVDDKNFLDVTEKMNQMLASCVKFKLPNGKMGSYKYLKDGDRLFLIFMIRELTFISGNSLAKDVTCESCKHEFSVPFRVTTNASEKRSIYNHDAPEELEKFFDNHLKCYKFNINGADYKLAPPTIGIQETFYDNIKTNVQTNKDPNVSFLKIIPFMLWDRTTITDDGIKAKEDEYKRLDMTTFQLLNQIVDKMIFGPKELKYECNECGMEVHTDMSFPDGASSIFVISNPFDELIKK